MNKIDEKHYKMRIARENSVFKIQILTQDPSLTTCNFLHLLSVTLQRRLACVGPTRLLEKPNYNFTHYVL